MDNNLLAEALSKVVDYIEEPCNRLDMDDFERGEAAMASTIYWIITDTLGGVNIYGTEDAG
jgi:hypothetical protein